jgi:protein-disulfide isomerase
MPKEYKILAAIALGAVILGVVLFKFSGEPASNTPLVERSGAYTKGVDSARVTVSEFADFQCPACRNANDIANQLLLAYPNDVKFVFRHFPLSGHPHAMVTAQAAEAAGAQGKFWEMHDLLYEKQNQWGSISESPSRNGVIDLLKSYAGDIGIDQTTFIQAVESNAYAEIVNEDISDGSASGVNATPTFFVNNVKIAEPSFEAIKAEIEKALAQ